MLGLVFMALVKEGTDKAGDLSTTAVFSSGDTFRGWLQQDDRDWIAIDLVAGHTYEFKGSVLNQSDFYAILPVIRDGSGNALTRESGTFRYDDFPERTIFTAENTGTYYVDVQYNWRPFLDYRVGFPGTTNYEITAVDYGVVGLSETIDAPSDGLITPYELGVGETFSGTIDADGAVDGSIRDGDSIVLNLPSAGEYSVTITQNSSDPDVAIFGKLAYLHRQYEEIVSGTTSDGSATLTFSVAATSQRVLALWDRMGPAGDDYTVTLSYLGPVDPPPVDPDRPIDPNPITETTDLPTDETTVVLNSGQTLLGTLNSVDDDWVGINVVAGTNYSFWFTGTGANPLVSGGARVTVEDKIWFAQYTPIGRYDFYARETGTLYFNLVTNSHLTSVEEYYSFTFTETLRLDEVEDAPATAATPYALEDGSFKGFLHINDRDWVSVQLIEGHTYTAEVVPVFQHIVMRPVVRDAKGNALTTTAYENREPIVFTATESGLHFLEPLDHNGWGDEYEIRLTDHGVLGLVETVDADSNTNYTLRPGETFEGSLTDNSDYDRIYLDVDGPGLYRVRFSEANGNTDMQLRASIFQESHPLDELDSKVEEDGSDEVFFYAHDAETFRLTLEDWAYSGGDYLATLELVANPAIDEVTDAPAAPHSDYVATVGESFTGWAEQIEDDYIPIDLVAGEAYRFRLEGFGPRPLSDGTQYILDENGNRLATQQAETFEVVYLAETTGRHFIQIDTTNNGFIETEPGFYELSPLVYDGVQTGTENAERLVGIDWDERIEGNGGDDTLAGGGGLDTLLGGDGDDQIFGSGLIEGGDGNDFIRAFGANDTVVGGRGDDRIYLGGGNNNAAGSAGNDTLRGEDGNDLLRGGTGQDQLSGGCGNDSLRGQKDGDTLLGGQGDDNLKGGGGNDSLVGDFGDDFLRGGTRRDYLDGGYDNDILIGNSFDDTLIGGFGDDFLSGGGENDILNGGDGWDAMKGGAGADTFAFAPSIFPEIDIILDFDVALDRLSVDTQLAASFDDLVLRDVSQGQRQVFNGASVTYSEAGLILEFSENQWLYLIGLSQDTDLGMQVDFI